MTRFMRFQSSRHLAIASVLCWLWQVFWDAVVTTQRRRTSFKTAWTGRGRRDVTTDAKDVVDALDHVGDDGLEDGVDADDATDVDDASDADDTLDVDTEEPEVIVPSFPLVTGGVSSHVIVVADDASPSEKTAANEIQALFKEASGVELPIVAEPESEDVPVIVVGAGAQAARFGVEPDMEELGTDGFVLKTAEPSVVIAGNPAAGTMYGVHRFLEIALNVRWTAPGVTIVPKTPDIVFPQELDLLEKPAFKWRLTSYNWPGGDRAFRAHQGETTVTMALTLNTVQPITTTVGATVTSGSLHQASSGTLTPSTSRKSTASAYARPPSFA